MKTIYEDEKMRISLTEHDYDFIAVIENLTDYDMNICPCDDSNIIFETFCISAHDWVGVLANENGYSFLSAIENEQYYREVFC